MFAREEHKEQALLLNNLDKARGSIDTLAMLNRIEKQNELQIIHEIMALYKTTTIGSWEKYKYVLHFIVGTLVIAGISDFVAFIIKLPNLSNTIINEFISEYNNTFVKTINNTCGNLIPLQEMILNPNFLSTTSGFCANAILSNIEIKNAFNLTVPNQNFTCTDKFISPDVSYTCQNAANNYYHNKDFDIGKLQFQMMVLFPCCLFVWLVIWIFSAIWIENKNQLNKLPEVDLDTFFQTLRECGVETNNDKNMKVTHAIDLLDTTIKRIPNDNKFINKCRHKFFICREDPDSSIPSHLPDIIARKILYFSALFLKPPIEMTAEECEKILAEKILAEKTLSMQSD